MIYVQPRVPRVVQVALGLTLVASLLAALAPSGWYGHLTLAPAAIWRGEVWRLLTWPWIETGPWSLVFTVATIYWFGGDLATAWGERRFARYVGAILLAAGLGTAALALALPSAWDLEHLGGLALGDALVIAWALQFPTRQVHFYGVIALGGDVLAYGTLAFTVLCAVYVGVDIMLPELIAGVVALGMMTDAGGRWARMASRRAKVGSFGDDDGPRWMN